MDKTSLGDRMKRYEATTKSSLLPRTPTIIRVDGKAFHTWTKQLRGIDGSLKLGPYSGMMHFAMASAMYYAAKEMQNCQMAYTQSDEISFLLNDWKTLETQQWFGGNIQKIASVTAGMVTAEFIRGLMVKTSALLNNTADFPVFDARVFQLPKEEVANYFIWRQQDATRNSINMLGQYHFSHKALHGRSTSMVQDMLMLDKGVNWNDIITWKKRGSCAVRETTMVATDWTPTGNEEIKSDGSATYMSQEVTDVKFVERSKLILDEEIPIFTKDREYIERFL